MPLKILPPALHNIGWFSPLLEPDAWYGGSNLSEWLNPDQITNGTAVTLTTTASVGYPTGLVKGNGIILFVDSVDSTIDSTSLSNIAAAGFTQVSSGSGGGINDSKVFLKAQATGAESGTISLSTAAGTKGHARMDQIQCPAGYVLSVTSATQTTDSTSDTNFSVTTASMSGAMENIVIACGSAVNTSTGAWNSFNITSSGFTVSSGLGTWGSGRQSTTTYEWGAMHKDIISGTSGTFTPTMTGNQTGATGLFHVLIMKADIPAPTSNNFTQDLFGVLSFTGAHTKRTAKALAGALSFVGAFFKLSRKSLAGVLSFTGAIAKQPRKALSGALSFAGAQSRKTGKALSGALGFTGSLVKKTSRTLTGGLGFTGALASSRIFLRTLTGSLSFSASPAASYPAVAASLSPAIFLALDETSGTTLDDTGSLNKDWGTVNSPTLGDPGLTATGTSVKFVKASSQYATVSDAAITSFVNGLSGLTVAAWMNVPSGAEEPYAVVASDGGSHIPLAMGIGGQLGDIHRLHFGHLASGNWYYVFDGSSPGTVDDGAAHFFVGTITSGGEITLYRDAVQVAQSTLTAPTWSSWTGTDIHLAKRWDFYGPGGGPYRDITLDGVAIFDGVLTSGQITDLYNAGSVSGGGGGGLTKKTSRTHAGALGFAGALQKKTLKALAAAGLGFAGSLRKTSSRTLAGVLSFSGALANSKTYVRVLTAALSFTGATSKRTGKALTGGLSFTGAQSKRTSKPLAGGVSFSGAITKRTGRLLTGGLSFAGLVSKQTKKALAGALSFAGNLATSLISGSTNYTQNLTASLGFTGNLTKRTARSLAGSLGFTGAISKSTSRTLAGGLSFAGAISKRTSRLLTGALGFTGAVAKRVSRTQAAALSFTGAQFKRTGKTLTGVLSFTGSISKRTGKALAGALSFAGSISKRVTRTLAGVLSFSGSLTKRTGKPTSGALGFTGSLAKLGGKAFSGLLQFNQGVGSSPTFRGWQFQRTAGTGTVTVNRTTGWTGSAPAVGTYLLAFASAVDMPNFDTLTLTQSTGWTRISGGEGGGLAAWDIQAYWRVADGTANDTLTLTDGEVSGSDSLQVTVVGWDGVASMGTVQQGYQLATTTVTAASAGASGDALTFAILDQCGNSGSNPSSGNTWSSISGTMTARQNGWAALVATEVLGTPGTRSATSGTSDNYYYYAVPLSPASASVNPLTKKTSKALPAGLSFSGSIAKKMSRLLTGVLSFSGSLASVLNGGAIAYTQNFTAALGFTGNLTKRTSKALVGALSFSGALSVTKVFFRTFTGALSFTGTQTKKTGKALSGVLSFSGSHSIRQILVRSFSAALSFAGATTKQTRRSLAGSVGFSGSLTKRAGKALAGALSFGGSLSKRTSKALAGALGFTGTLLKRFPVRFTAALGFAGAVTKRTGKRLTGTLTSAGTLATGRMYFRTFTASLSFSGSISKRIGKSLASALNFIPGFSFITNILNPPPKIKHPSVVVTMQTGSVEAVANFASVEVADHSGSLNVTHTGTSVEINSESGDVQ